MTAKTVIGAVALALSLTGAALAQTPAGGGSAEGNMNNPGSVKSNSDKAMERSTGSATGGTMAAPGASGGPATDTPGAPAGSGSGNGTTGSGAAPSGR